MGTFDGYAVAPLVDGVDSRELIAYDVMYVHDSERLANIEPSPSFSKRCSHPLCGGNSQPRNDLFVVKVRGKSMIDGQIADGDFVVVRKRENCDNGDTVVAMVDRAMTLKKYYRKKDQIRLEPMNAAMEPILAW